ncbi:MAG TPA: hypothetical protein VFP40_04640, partial [Terriglobales bacterium]|nr:hypothetical protein [Terriglobales bacterium]
MSGVFGLLAFSFILAALFVREDAGRRLGDLMFRGHDVAAVLQSLFMIQVIAAVKGEAGWRMSRTSYWTGSTALWAVICLLLLTIFHLVNDMLYMVPMGVFGAWLIGAVWASDVLPRYIRWLGTV